MKRPVSDQLGKASRIIAAGVLCFGLAGCGTLSGGNGQSSLSGSSGSMFGGFGLPITVSPKCLSWDVVKETWGLLQEPPTIESALDRVNTAARIIEVGDLILHTLPISGGSEWPQKANGSVPMSEENALRQLIQQDPAYYAGAAGQTSALKLKAMYLQTLLFNKYPDLYALRKAGAAAPAESEVNALATKVLGPGYSPAFTKVFYRLLHYNPAFEPKADLFAGRAAGTAMEVYPSLFDAVMSLAENKPEILRAQESVLQAEEKKGKERRDILEIVQRIQKLEAEEFGNPSTPEEAVKASERDTNAKEVEELKAQLAVQEEEFKVTVTAYKEELAKLGIEMGQIKTQVGAFTPEQRALAANIQTAVDAVQGTMCQSEILLGIAGYHLKKAGPNWKKEVQKIANESGQTVNERIKRVTLNLAALPANLSVLMIELGVLDEEAKVQDDLFTNRMSVDSGGGGIGASWMPRVGW
ncbi:MAG: hypothetical protein RI101_03900 [Nitrospira sp.]|nr:hypothetical protein [Nitrospira sp.]